MIYINPVLSICCITYNHENFIRQALDGFLMQQTNFPIEIIIHDDASTDNTANIIREYQGKHPHLIKTILQTKNQYLLGRKVFPITFKEAQGKYIALCEGDDYWTDPLKLQKQVDFLEANPEYSGAFHQVQVLEEDGTWGDPLRWWQDLGERLDITFEDTISNTPPFHTSSFLFRRDRLHLPKDFSRYASGDMALYVILSSQGKFRRIPENMSVYRKHLGGITNTVAHKDNGTFPFLFLNRLYLFTSLRNYLRPKGFQRFNSLIKFLEDAIVESLSRELTFSNCWDNLAKMKRFTNSTITIKVLIKLGIYLLSSKLRNIAFRLKCLIPSKVKTVFRSLR